MERVINGNIPYSRGRSLVLGGDNPSTRDLIMLNRLRNFSLSGVNIFTKYQDFSNNGSLHEKKEISLS
jgi:hypothetical protein